MLTIRNAQMDTLGQSLELPSPVMACFELAVWHEIEDEPLLDTELDISPFAGFQLDTELILAPAARAGSSDDEDGAIDFDLDTELMIAEEEEGFELESELAVSEDDSFALDTELILAS